MDKLTESEIAVGQNSLEFALSQPLLDEGFAFTLLFTDLSNPNSNSIYMQIGYQPLADFEKYRLLIGD